ncbi:multiple inositol polyphosphate phosphatase 1b, partial [Stegastes partitus]|uniref:Multiple inositol polyphosphate phosphatase 1b n=1 Tax=Stegastes partitus TaxID=144197 RepID=A0A9Y4NSP0_9TELE
LVEAAFFLCSYELSIRSVHSPWCFLFDKSDAKVLEYQSDLKQYWKRSHGHVISSLSSCPLFHHIFRTLDKAGRPRRSTDASPEPASILVGHAETLLPLLSLLGLYKDETPPTASNYQSQHGRTFRTSRIVPYAANLLFVLFDCQRGPRLQLLVNESPVRFPGLQAEDAPLYRDVRAAYRHLLDGCDFHRECEGRSGGRGPNTEL